MFRRTLFLSLFLSLLILISCHGVKVKPIPNADKIIIKAPKYKVGDEWQYTKGYFEKIIGFSDNYIITTSNLSKYYKGYRVYRDKNYTSVKILDAQGRSTDAPTGLKDLDFPLQIGKKWDQTLHLTVIKDGARSTYYNTFKIIAYEEITVKAGTFKAFRIRWRQNQIGTSWSGHLDMWWSPKVKNFIKRLVYVSKWVDNYELVSFKIN